MNCKNKLVIIGAGPLRMEIEKYINENNIENVDLRGAIYGAEMDKIIEKSKVVVAPSEWYENCPYAIMQSMAKGKIVVASRIGGLPQLIEDDKSGFLFESGNAKSLAKTISKAISLDKQEYENMSYQVLETAKKMFNWEKYINKLVLQYQMLLNDNN
jgi:glycosyltransferase involved in cell wall biosynthesis